VELSVNIAVEDCHTFSETIHHLSDTDNDSAQFIVINIEGDYWFGCKVCGVRLQQWNAFSSHFMQHHARAPGASEQNQLSASSMIEDGKCEGEPFHTILNTTENSEQSPCSSIACKSEELTAVTSSDVSDMSEDLELDDKKIFGDCLNVINEVYCKKSGDAARKSNSLEITKPYRCTFCNVCIDDRSKLQKHLEEHGVNRLFKCSVCKRSFNRSNNLRNHVKRHKAKQPFACSVCDFQFPNVTELCEHLKLHPKPFGCSLCSNSYVRFDHLCHHIKIAHSQMRPYKCSICEQTFKERHHMVEHMSVHTDPEGHRYKCTICSKQFQTRDPYKRHMLVKHNVGSWHECSVCHQKYLYPNYLQEHMRTHEDRKPYPCSQCPRRFQSRSGLRTHLVWHSGERNFACDCCGRTFYRRSHAQSHFKVHLKE